MNWPSVLFRRGRLNSSLGSRSRRLDCQCRGLPIDRNSPPRSLHSNAQVAKNRIAGHAQSGSTLHDDAARVGELTGSVISGPKKFLNQVASSSSSMSSFSSSETTDLHLQARVMLFRLPFSKIFRDQRFRSFYDHRSLFNIFEKL